MVVFLILEAMSDDCVFILINLHDPNTKKYVSTWKEINLMLEIFNDLENKINLGGDLNLFLDSVLEAKGSSLSIIKSLVSKLTEINKKYNLCDIWRIRNTREKCFTF